MRVIQLRAIFLIAGLTTLVGCSNGSSSTQPESIQPPTGLIYTNNQAIYTTGAMITPNLPFSNGGAVASYSVSPSLPVGLNFSTTTGEISGVPTAATDSASYMVTASNTGGSSTITLTIAVIEPLTIPLLSTAFALSISQTSAISGGEIVSDGGATITARGVCWSITQNPTIKDFITSDGSGAGSFISLLTGLSAGTNYYVRAHATNRIGTAYGNQWFFSTDPSKVTDIDGNVYNVLRIGTQLWMRENLQTTRYRDGSSISNVTGTRDWINLVNTSTEAYCDYNNDPTYKVYGRYYNFFAVADSRNLCPAGWHVPTDNEWKILELFLGMSQDQVEIENDWRGTDEGGKLKSTERWNTPNTGATNLSGFTALPGGRRNDSGIFLERVIYGNWWTATEHDTYTALDRRLSHGRSTIYRRYETKNYGQSVRCIKD